MTVFRFAGPAGAVPALALSLALSILTPAAGAADAGSAAPLTQRDWLRPATPEPPKRRLRPALVLPAAAAAVGALAIAMWFLAATREDPIEPIQEPVPPQVAFKATPVEPIERREIRHDPCFDRR